MKIGGIIAEYNPFHHGHAYHIQKTKEMGASHVVVCMSGNFVQRGQPACFSKWARARAAIENGADLVVELPTPFATAPANDFAYASVDLLHRLGVQMLSFGSECGDVNLLRQTLRLCVMAEQNEAFQKSLASGQGHPKARETALQELFGDQYVEVLRAPNNLLALEYLRAIATIDPLMEPVTVARLAVDHDADTPQEHMASASYLRDLLYDQEVEALRPFVPPLALRVYQTELLAKKGPIDPTAIDRLLLHTLRQMTASQIATIDGVCEGLENRILAETKTCKTFAECVDAVATKRYTKARIRRILLHILLGQQADVHGKTAQYVRVLAMNENGKEILRNAKYVGLPMSPKFADLASDEPSQAMLEVRATDLYSLLTRQIQPAGREYTEQIIIYR